MSSVRIEPSAARGTVAAPPSKSMAHRALICAALAPGKSRIENLAMSEDIKATVGALRALGADIEIDVQNGTALVTGMDPKSRPASDIIDCRESGSTLRFMIPLCLLRGGRMKLAGSRRLFERPLSVYEELFRRDHIYYRKTENGIELEGKLAGGAYPVRGDISSQFITGLLLALPMLGKDSCVTVTGGLQSGPYVGMTLEMQRIFGAEIDAAVCENGNLRYSIGKDCCYHCADYTVEGDWSNAALLDLLGIAGKNELDVTGLHACSLQGDRVYQEYYEQIRNYEPAEGMTAPGLDIADCPDLGPALIAAAAMCHGAVLTGTARLAIKESDRGHAMAEELAKFGIGITVREDSIVIPDAVLQAPEQSLSGHNDHRIVMALAALCTVTGGVIEGAEAVKKSFPDFFEKIGKAGIILQGDETIS